MSQAAPLHQSCAAIEEEDWRQFVSLKFLGKMKTNQKLSHKKRCSLWKEFNNNNNNNNNINNNNNNNRYLMRMVSIVTHDLWHTGVLVCGCQMCGFPN